MIRARPTHRTTSTMSYVPLVRDEALTIHARLWHDIPRLQLLRWLLHTFYRGDRGKGGSCEVRWPARSRGREIGFCVSFYGFGSYPSHGLQPRFSKVHSGIQKQVVRTNPTVSCKLVRGQKADPGSKHRFHPRDGILRRRMRMLDTVSSERLRFEKSVSVKESDGGSMAILPGKANAGSGSKPW